MEYVRQQRSPCSLNEIAFGTGYKINAVSGRVNEMKKAGELVETDKRPCTITGRTIRPVTAASMQMAPPIAIEQQMPAPGNEVGFRTSPALPDAQPIQHC